MDSWLVAHYGAKLIARPSIKPNTPTLTDKNPGDGVLAPEPIYRECNIPKDSGYSKPYERGMS